MSAVVIYESLTGTTAKASAMIADKLSARGLLTAAYPVDNIDFQALSDASLVIVGGWTDGLVFFGQKPGRAWKLAEMPAIAGKRAVVFATYAVDPGPVLEKLVAIVEGRGADVLGGMTIRRGRLDSSTDQFVQRVMDEVNTVPS